MPQITIPNFPPKNSMPLLAVFHRHSEVGFPVLGWGGLLQHPHPFYNYFWSLSLLGKDNNPTVH